jgi:putative ABC transport system ATP-binding protein
VAQVVRAEGLRRAFGQGEARRVAVDGVSLSVTAGEFLTVFGPSGSGKSTLLGIVGTLDRGFEGRLQLDGRDVRGMSDRDLSRLRGERIGFVFQAFYLLDHLTVIENVTVPFLFTPRTRPRRTAMRALERVGLEDRAKDLTAGLSGGQRQRVAIARAIVHAPALLLCDEPTGNLDAETAAQIIDIFVSLHRDDGVTVLCATHDERIAKVATRAVRMRDGRFEAPTEEVAREDA